MLVNEHMSSFDGWRADCNFNRSGDIFCKILFSQKGERLSFEEKGKVSL